MKILKSIELREDNIDEVIDFTEYNGNIDPSDGKFKFTDYGGARVSVDIGDHIGKDGLGGYHLLGFAPNIVPEIISIVENFYKGIYNPITNEPNIINGENVVNIGFCYALETDGDFSGRKVKAGDFIRALVDNPKNDPRDWEVIRKNIDLIYDSHSWVTTLKDNKEYYRKAINDLTALCAGLAKEAGWDKKPRETGTELMLVVSEVSEAMEGDRKDLMDDHLPHRKMFDVELGDAQIRIFHLAGRKQIDLGSAMVEKLIYNTTREDHKPENRDKENGKKY